jgi:hypothetical protein
MSESLTHADRLAAVPALLAETAASWGLTLGEAHPPGAAGRHAVRAELPDGKAAVLKLSNPHRESWLLEEA